MDNNSERFNFLHWTNISYRATSLDCVHGWGGYTEAKRLWDIHCTATESIHNLTDTPRAARYSLTSRTVNVPK
jgi:hypothetical protein